MSPLTILDKITIASPCPADWDEMLGDDRARFCSSCSKQVYNIASMTAEEASALILEKEGRLCAGISRRHDGTVLTADCPVGRRKLSAGRRLRRSLALAVFLPVVVVAGLSARTFGSGRHEPFPTGPGVTWDDQLDWALATLGIRSQRVTMRGMICLPPELLTPDAPTAPDEPEAETP